MPSVKTNSKKEFDDMDSPTAESGRPIPVIFGEHNVPDVNILYYGDKNTNTREVSA